MTNNYFMKSFLILILNVLFLYTVYGQDTDSHNKWTFVDSKYIYHIDIASAKKLVSKASSEFRSTQYINSYSSMSDETKLKLYTGALVVSKLGDDAAQDILDAIDSSLFIKFTEIGVNERFRRVGYGNHFTVLKNIKTAKFYIISVDPFGFRDFSRSDKYGFKGLFDVEVPKPTLEQQKYISLYRKHLTALKNNMNILSAIQKRYLTYGYFDSSKVGKSDRTIFNLELRKLNKNFNNVTDLLKFNEDVKSIFEMLELEEQGTYNTAKSWIYNMIEI